MRERDEPGCSPLRWLVLMVACSPVWADDATHPCARVVEPERRLACYDAAFPPSAEVREAAARGAEESFGLQPAAATTLASGQPAAEADPKQLSSRVAKITLHSNGRIVALENGQVWILTEATSRGQMQVGDEVVVRRAAMDSSLLVTPAGVSLRARRSR
jgi:hypothetical protein